MQKYKKNAIFAAKDNRKMRKTFQFIRKYPLSTVLIAAIWVICLVPIPENPLSNISMMDKWTHIVMYFTLSMTIAWERYRNRKKTFQSKEPWTDVALYVWLLPVMMGGVVELAQSHCTAGVRNGDWLDFFANASGCTLAVICILLARCRAKA